MVEAALLQSIPVHLRVQAACRRPSPPLDLALLRDQQPADTIVQVHVARPAAGAAAGEATPRTAAAGAAAGAGLPHVPASGKRPPPPSLSDGKRQKLAGVGELGHDDDASTQFRCAGMGAPALQHSQRKQSGPGQRCVHFTAHWKLTVAPPAP